MQVSRGILLGLLSELSSRSISREQFLREAGILESELSTLTFDLGLTIRAVRTGYRLTQDPALALRIGMQAPWSMLGVVGDVLLRCPTLRSVLTEVDQYVTLVAPACGFRLEERPGTSLLHFSTTFPDPAITRVVTEMAMSFVLRIARHHISAVVRPSGIAFAFPEPAHAHVYREVFDCPVRFGAETTAIYFDTHLLDETQPFADEALRGLLKVRADELLKQARDSRGLANRVRYALEREPDLSNVSMARMAKRIGMSPSELRRRLREEHTSWTHALAEARREMALRKLRNPEIPIKQIADETGFSEPSAFHRAFRRWTGSTPARFRAEALHERGLRNSA